MIHLSPTFPSCMAKSTAVIRLCVCACVCVFVMSAWPNTTFSLALRLKVLYARYKLSLFFGERTSPHNCHKRAQTKARKPRTRTKWKKATKIQQLQTLPPKKHNIYTSLQQHYTNMSQGNSLPLASKHEKEKNTVQVLPHNKTAKSLRFCLLLLWFQQCGFSTGKKWGSKRKEKSYLFQWTMPVMDKLDKNRTSAKLSLLTDGHKNSLIP